MYGVDIATSIELRDWNRIVSRCPYSEALHTLEWRNALAKCFKQLTPLYFIIRNSRDDIAGVFPCFIFNPIPLSRMLLSMPWALPGGPLVFPGANAADVTLSIVKELDGISYEHHYLETTITLLPNSNPDVIDSLSSTGYAGDSNHFTHILDITKGYDPIWNAYNKRVRGAVRKAWKAGVIVRETEDATEMMEFYKLYLASMKRFKSTPKPYQLLRYLQISPIARLVVAQLRGRIIAGLLFLHFNSSVRLWCEASDPDFLNYRPNNAVIDYIIQWACKNGYPCVDFGASPSGGEGLIAFKEEWRAQKARFYMFTKLHSSLRKKMWTISEPALRRLYAAIQRFKLRSIW